VFAPPAGRYLAVGGSLLALLYVLWASAVLPRTLALFALLLATTAPVVFLAVFFRDPERSPGADIVSPADGRVRAVDRDATTLRISVFMNVHNVHVNRFPLDATVERVDDQGAGSRPAYREDSRHNARRHYHVSTSLGPVEIIQMTGFVARRLVSYVKAGAARKKGERLGMIALGSRVDVLLPADRVEPLVAVGQLVLAGETPIARSRP